MSELFSFLTNVQPIGVIALLGLIIYILIGRRNDQKDLKDNHLHELPEIANTLRRMEVQQREIAENIVHIKARVNGPARL